MTQTNKEASKGSAAVCHAPEQKAGSRGRGEGVFVLPAAVAFLNGHVLIISGRDARSRGKSNDKEKIKSQTDIVLRQRFEHFTQAGVSQRHAHVNVKFFYLVISTCLFKI